MAFDIYYNETLYKAAVANTGKEITRYIRSTQMKQYKDKTFDDSLDEGFLWEENRKRIRVSDKDLTEDLTKKNPHAVIDVIRDEDIERWGAGFDSTDYETLNSHYQYLKTANPNCDSNQEIFIIDLCYTKMQQMKAVREGRVDDYNKLTDSYRKSFQQAGLKTVQDESTVNQDCWSSLTGMISQYTPEEYYKDKNLYKDFDNIGEYYDRHAIRPLRNIINGTAERDYEYYVHEDEDGDDLLE